MALAVLKPNANQLLQSGALACTEVAFQSHEPDDEIAVKLEPHGDSASSGRPLSSGADSSLCAAANSEASVTQPVPVHRESDATVQLTRLSSSLSSPAKHAVSTLSQERHQGRALHELQRQLHEISAALLSGPSHLSDATDACAAVAALVRENAAAADRVEVARLVAGMCARAATAAELRAAWEQERDALHAQLEQAAQLGEAMLRHKRDQAKLPEAWRQQLMNGAVAVGCSALGAAAAVALIKGIHHSGA